MGATSNFTLTNGVIHTADIDMRCQGMRLRYNGSVDLEGRLSGSLSITCANSEDWRTVQGYGAVSLRDGLI